MKINRKPLCEGATAIPADAVLKDYGDVNEVCSECGVPVGEAPNEVKIVDDPCDHLIGRNARDSGHGARPVGEQICLSCKKTLKSIMQDYAIEAQIELLRKSYVDGCEIYVKFNGGFAEQYYRIKQLEQLRTTNQTSKGEE